MIDLSSLDIGTIQVRGDSLYLDDYEIEVERGEITTPTYRISGPGIGPLRREYSLEDAVDLITHTIAWLAKEKER